MEGESLTAVDWRERRVNDACEFLEIIDMVMTMAPVSSCGFEFCELVGHSCVIMCVKERVAPGSQANGVFNRET